MNKDRISRRYFIIQAAGAGTGAVLGWGAFIDKCTLSPVVSALAETVDFNGWGINYRLVDTGQTKCYNDRGGVIACPSSGEAFYGQDAQYPGNQPAYVDNGDGTVTDLNTGLMWVKARGSKVSWDDAVSAASSCRVGGYTDWRMPTIKELYSLIDFNGRADRTASRSTPYIDTRYFDFKYGDESSGERAIDCQDWSATEYVSTTMGGNPTAFGVNFADGRIKGYGKYPPSGRSSGFGQFRPPPHRSNEGGGIPPGRSGGRDKRYVRYVRGNRSYGLNRFVDNGNGTVTDNSTGLMWSQTDSARGMNWEKALAWVQTKNREYFLDYNDWRLPNAKELQSIVDYTRSPDTTGSAAVNPIFRATSITNEGGALDYPYYWTGTTHLDGPPDISGTAAVYVAFGRALGYMEVPMGSGRYRLLDVHGAGAQRSDPKNGDPADYPRGRGPQGDVIRINNFVRPVRDAAD